MTTAEQHAIELLTSSVNAFQVRIAADLMPRHEIEHRLESFDAEDQRLHQRVSRIDHRVTRVTIMVGVAIGVLNVLTLAGVGALIRMGLGTP